MRALTALATGLIALVGAERAFAETLGRWSHIAGTTVITYQLERTGYGHAMKQTHLDGSSRRADLRKVRDERFPKLACYVAVSGRDASDEVRYCINVKDRLRVEDHEGLLWFAQPQ